MVDSKYIFHIIGSDETKRAFLSIGKSIRRTVNLAGTMGAGIAAGMAVMVSRSVEANTEMTRLAESVGVSSQTMSEWAHAAETVNVQGDKMADIFKDVQDKIGDFATTGGGGAADMFEKLNLDVKEFIGLAPDEQLIKIGEALDTVSSRSEKIFFLEALAGDASRLLPLLEDNAEQLRTMQEEARDLGVSISDVDAAKLEAANRSFERIQSVVTGVGNKLAVEVAPIVEVLAEKFVETAIEGDRLGSTIRTGFELGAKGAGVLADGVHGIKVVLKGLEVAFEAWEIAVAFTFQKIAQGAVFVGNAIIDGVVFPLRKGLEVVAQFSDEAADALTSLEEFVGRARFEVSDGFAAGLARSKADFAAAKAEFQDLVMQDLPSAVIKENINRIMDETEALALQRAAEVRERLQADTGGNAIQGVEDTEAQEHMAKLAARLQRIDDAHLTELQMLATKLAEEQAIIQEAEDAKLITEEQAQARRLRAWEAFQSDKRKLEERSQKAGISILKTGQSIIESFVGTGSKRLFGIQKTLALAHAAVSLPAAIIESFKNAGGYPWGIPAAAAMAASGAAQISAIQGQGLGGGASAPSIGTGGGATPQAPRVASIPTATPIPGDQASPIQSKTELHVHFNGDVNGDQGIQDMLLTAVRDLVDSDAILIPGSSRQATEIREGGIS